MFKMLNPKRFYRAVGKRKFLEFILLAAFILFFYGPLINMLMLAFANEYQAPAILPQEWGFKWWQYVFSQDSLVSSIVQSFIVAIVTTIVSAILCIPAAYSIARFKYRGRKLFMLSFLLTNAFPKLGIYTSIAVLFYKYNLMGTYTGVIIIHMINSMMFMVWLRSGTHFLQGYPPHGYAWHFRCNALHVPGLHGGGTGHHAGRHGKSADHAGRDVRYRFGLLGCTDRRSIRYPADYSFCRPDFRNAEIYWPRGDRRRL